VGRDEFDEELPQPPRLRDRPRAQRLRLDLGLGAVGIALVALVGVAVSHHGHGPGSVSGPPSSPAGLPTPPGRVFVPDAAGVTGGVFLPAAPPLSRSLAHCPRAGTCLVVPGVSSSVRAAVRAAFPGAAITSAERVQLSVQNYGDALIALDVNARRGADRILVRLRGAPDTDLSRTTGHIARSMIFGGYRIMRYETPLARYYVVVELVAPAGEQRSVQPLVRLARDVRLLDHP
jgi:hypothetical protein